MLRSRPIKRNKGRRVKGTVLLTHLGERGERTPGGKQGDGSPVSFFPWKQENRPLVSPRNRPLVSSSAHFCCAVSLKCGKWNQLLQEETWNRSIPRHDPFC